MELNTLWNYEKNKPVTPDKIIMVQELNIGGYVLNADSHLWQVQTVELVNEPDVHLGSRLS